MTTVAEYYRHAELALAAYATLTPGISGAAYTNALIDESAGMSADQAQRFSERWRVVDQYNHSEQTPIYDDGGRE